MTTLTAKRTSIDPRTEVGSLSLTVSDLERSVGFYTQDIGLRTLEQGPKHAALGVADAPLLFLKERPGAKPWPRGGRGFTGLYHFALLLPSRAALGAWVQHWLDRGHSVGQGDHGVSEALYLEDPDGHGIEIYRDRPRDQWRWIEGRVQMSSGPVDIAGMINDAKRQDIAYDGLPSGAKMGHIHLQVADIGTAKDFYQDILGFDTVAEMPTALFLSAGGYHHHIGMNTWHSAEAGPPQEDTVALRSFTVKLPDEAALSSVVERLDLAGHAHSDSDSSVVEMEDPFKNHIILTTD